MLPVGTFHGRRPAALSKKSFYKGSGRVSPLASQCREPGIHLTFRQKPHFYAQEAVLLGVQSGLDAHQTTLQALQRSCPIGERQRLPEP